MNSRLIYHFKLPMILFWIALFLGEAIVCLGIATVTATTGTQFWGVLEICFGAVMVFDAIIIAVIING